MLDNNRTKLIVDTDIEAAYDDVGALAVMHALCAKGEAEVLAVICDSIDSNGGPCIDVINNYYGRSDIPIGTVKIYDYESNQRYDRYREYMKKFPREKRYNEYIKGDTRLERVTNRDYCDAVEVYRRTLSIQPDNSVVICVIGYLTAIEQLLKSKGDLYSILDGCELVKKKVKKMVTMSDIPFPEEGSGSFNWDMDFEAAKYVINNMPCPISISRYGRYILTGRRLLTETCEDNPVRKAYKRSLTEGKLKMSSWDQVAMLYAIRGEGEVFTEKKGYELKYHNEKNKFIWKRGINIRQDVFVDINVTNEKLAEIIEDLMVYRAN